MPDWPGFNEAGKVLLWVAGSLCELQILGDIERECPEYCLRDASLLAFRSLCLDGFRASEAQAMPHLVGLYGPGLAPRIWQRIELLHKCWSEGGSVWDGGGIMIEKVVISLLQKQLAFDLSIRDYVGEWPEDASEPILAICDAMNVLEACADLLGVPLDGSYCRDWLFCSWEEVVRGRRSVDEFLGELKQAAGDVGGSGSGGD